jgi:hypothetical protein
MEVIDGIRSVVMVLVVDEAEALALALLVPLDEAGRDGAELSKEGLELLVGRLGVEVLDVDVGELLLGLVELSLALLESS